MSPPRRSIPKWLLALCVPLVLLGVGAGALSLWLGGDGLRLRILERVRPVLEARLGPVHLGEDVHVGWTGTVTLGPLELPGARPEGPPVVRIERLRVFPRLRALLAGQVEVSRVVLSDVAVEAGPEGAELRALIERLRSPRPSPPPSSTGETGRATPTVEIEGLRLSIERHGRKEWGPFQARVSREDFEGGRGWKAVARLPGGGQLEALLGGSASGLGVTLKAHDVAVSPLLALAEPPWSTEAGTVEGDARVEGTTVTFFLTAKGLMLSDPRLAPQPVGPLTFSLDGRMSGDLAQRQGKLELLRVSVGERQEATLEVTGEADWKGPPRFSLKAELPPLTFAKALDALPPALVPREELRQQEGQFRATLTLAGPVSRREEWEFKAKLDVSRRKAADPEGPLSWLRAPFDYRPLTAEGRGRQLHIGPGNSAYVPLAEVPRVLVRAVLRSEDAAFWAHRGFDFESLSTLLLKPPDSKVRGGSTLTQQLAKNLYLTREKTYARKVKEAYLTLALEASVPKERLLEVYLNIIEWGPGLYGIGEAARHYFNKDARALDIREAAFLATIIPNPVRYHVYCTRGELSENWRKNVDGLLALLNEGGDLTAFEYQDALEAPLRFACGTSAQQEGEQTSAE